MNNADLARHTFSVVGTDVSHELPELRDVRFSIDVDPGRYQLICAVPGHESMTARLVVE